MSTEDPAAVYVTGEVQTVVVEDEFGQIRVLSVGVQGPAGTGIPSPVGIPDGRVATAVNDLVVWTDLDDRYEEVGAAAQLAATLGSAAFQNSGSFASAAQGVKADSAVQPDDLASVATTGDYDDLINKPTIPTVPVTSVDGEIGDVDLSGNYEEIGAAAALAATLGSAAYQDSTAFASAAQGAKADSAVQPGALAEVATTGSYDDLTDKPSIPSSPVTSVDGQTGVVDLSGAYEEIGAAAALAATLGSAAFANSGSFATAAQGARADSATQPEDLASVATTGDYDDLINKPSIPTIPDLAEVATTGQYGDLIGLPDISGFQVLAQKNQPNGYAGLDENGLLDPDVVPGGGGTVTSVDGEIGDVDLSGVYEEIGAAAALAATLGSAAFASTGSFATAAQGAKADTATQPGDLSTVATTGAYGDLSGRPTLGTAASQNSTAFATAAQGTKADTATQPADIASLVSGTGITNIVAITQTAYDALTPPDATTFYVITGA